MKLKQNGQSIIPVTEEAQAKAEVTIVTRDSLERIQKSLNELHEQNAEKALLLYRWVSRNKDFSPEMAKLIEDTNAALEKRLSN